MTFSSTLDTQKDISFHWFALQPSINNDTCNKKGPKIYKRPNKVSESEQKDTRI